MSKEDLLSYPPQFRLSTNQNRSFDSDDSHNSITESDPLPVIDFQSLNSEEVGRVCKDWGLFRLVNHEVPLALSNKLQEEAKKLFSLPFEFKEAHLTKALNYFWGTPALKPNGDAITERVQQINWVEGFHIPLTQLGRVQKEDEELKLHNFRCLVEEYGEHMGRVARIIFETWMENLGLDPILYSSYLSESTGLIRIYRYPHCDESKQVAGMEEHTDSAVLAIVSQDNVAGLQVFKDDMWIDVKPVTNTLILNLGDMMQAMSNDEYKSAKHMVKPAENKDRISICYFVFPEADSIIQSSKYKPFTYKEFQAQVQQDLQTIGVKIGLDRFKLGDNTC